ncbi:MAG: hypothetical protein Q4D53_07705 [Leptotrichiaceae bacterium]|nr:hypothetical protein [Leptotrichiaceae bacterium]
MNKKTFKKKLSALVIMIAMSNITFSAASKTVTAKNEKTFEINTLIKNNNEVKLDFYSESEIKEELKKAEVNDKSIKAFITANNNSRNKNISISQIKEEFLNASKLDEKNYLALNALGDIERKYSDGDTEASYYKAISYYEKVLKINPKFESAYKNLISVYGNLYEKMEEEENTKKAADFLQKEKYFSEQLIKLNPENPEGYSSLFNIYDLSKDYNKAVNMGKKAIELYFGNKEPKYYYYQIGNESPTYDYFHTNEYLGNITEFQLLETYMNKGDDKTVFDYFFKLYEKKRKRPDEYLSLKEDFKYRVKELNEKYKNTNKKLYEENLKKFKALELKNY